MKFFEQIRSKLEAFIRKFYWNQILKGGLLLVFFSMLYFLLIVALENALWFSSEGRAILFWSFIVLLGGLFLWFILLPLLKLLKLQDGLSAMQASEIIGKHFPEVADKLKNLLQLEAMGEASDLLLASIEQRSRELSPVPFSSAVDLKANYRYAKLLIFPVLIVVALFVAGKSAFLFDGFKRISHYETVYSKPAPFKFLIPENLKAVEGEDFMLQVETFGIIQPENVLVQFDGQGIFMKRTEKGHFQYVFPNMKESLNFRLKSNEITSEEFQIAILKTPKLDNFSMNLVYPSYTGIKNESLEGTGNAKVPAGTKVTWNFESRNTDTINFETEDSLEFILQDSEAGIFSKMLVKNLEYSVSTSNADFSNFQKVHYAIDVIPDEYPVIKMQQKRDSVQKDIQYFQGEVSDDYGLRKLLLEYYPTEKKEAVQQVSIPISQSAIDQFYFVFPGQLALSEGQNYEFYFRIFDNDGVHGSKSSKSETYSYYEPTAAEIEEQNLQNQSKNIQELNEEFEKFNNDRKETEEFMRLDKEENELKYNERKKLEEYLKRTQQQNELMKNYSEDLKKNLKESSESANPEFQKELEKRMEETEQKLEENEELLRELEKYTDKIEKEDLGKKLEELSKNNRNTERSLEQLLELTKRYYVEEKKQKLAQQLEKMAEQQEVLSERDSKPEEQEQLNEEFEKFQEDFNELEKENSDLKSPKDLQRDTGSEMEIEQDQKEAQENLEKSDTEKSKQKQKEAAQKMKQMASQMKQSSMRMEMQQLSMDAEALRQVLDNLIVFSFGQESLMNRFKVSEVNNSQYAQNLKEQNTLRENFEFIDDSLYSLALRNPLIGSAITDKLTDVQYNLDKSLERLGENALPQGISSQQYTLTGSNDLANLLSDILGNMQQMMSQPQAGQGGQPMEQQLQDIIEGQQQLGEKIMEQSQPEEGEEGRKTGEQMNGEIFQIYQEQQKLRQKMEEIMNQSGDKNGIKNEMEQVEEKILKGEFDSQLDKILERLNYELLKFQEATKQQGEDTKRESEKASEVFQNPLQNQINSAKDYFQSLEILNRQVLPLRPIFKEKVNTYFGSKSN
ncbi:MAG: hypothetical protein CME35_04595 [Gramella sp.]|nr:hypothetical protein [Christiangramia sp.]